jgi:transcriptional regulator with XRE-family HTH domain
MKFKDKYKVSEGFEDLFAFASEEEELEHDAQMLMYKFLEGLEEAHNPDKKLKKKELATALEKSPSFISQLYSGEKLLSLNLIAKIQKVFNISFEIKAKPNFVNYSEAIPESKDFNYRSEDDGFWVWKKFKDYSKVTKCCDSEEEPVDEFNAA